MDDTPSLSPMRRSLLALACIGTAVLCLVVWRWLIVQSANTWPDISFFFIPAIIGVLIGWVARLCTAEGNFGVSGFAAFLTILAGLVGIFMQSKAGVDYYLGKVASMAYEQTLAYAQSTLPAIAQDEDLLRAMSGSELTVIGRLAAGTPAAPSMDYWEKRTLLQVNWIMSANTSIYGQGGRDRSIYESSHLIAEIPFLDRVVSRWAKEPVPEEDLKRFRQLEAPYLEDMVAGRLSRGRYEAFLKNLVWSRIGLSSVLLHGFGPVLGGCLLLGVMASFWIPLRPSETTEI